MDIDKLIEKGEVAREKEKYDDALKFFDLAIIAAGSKNNWLGALTALGHRMIVYKHIYNKTGQKSFLELMLADSQAFGKILDKQKLPKEHLKVSLLRVADYHFLNGDFKQASENYKKALKLIPKSSIGQYAEYLSHYGLSLVALKDKSGIDKLTESLLLIDKATNLRAFHKLIIKSGILGRIAEATDMLGSKDMAQHAIDEALKLAALLETKYKMPMRHRQLKQLEQKINNQR